MREKIKVYYQRLSIVKKLSIPLIIAVIFGLLLTTVIVNQVKLIEHTTGLLKDTFIPALEKSTNNRSLLKQISENLTFATLIAEEDMVFEISSNEIIEKNLKEIISNKDLTLKGVDKYLIEFKEYFKVSTKYALDSIKNSDKDEMNEDNIEKLLKQYNNVKNNFSQLSLDLKKEISSKTHLIEKTAMQVIYFTIFYIIVFSIVLFFVSYLIYKDFNDRFNSLSLSLDKLGVKKSLSKDGDAIGMLSQNIDRAVEDYTIIDRQKTELVKINKNVKDSIEYASLIQQAILPSKDILDDYVKDSFIFWKPKDIVGGDIYFIAELESKDEVLIMVIDGAGHGVPGAFLTILVKAVENQIIGRINRGVLPPSPAIILEEFNRSIKTMLNQKKGSKSNAGFDGGVLYYNRVTNSCKYAGAKTPLYIINNSELEIIKSDRQNVGFIRTKIDQKYQEYDIDIKIGTKLYIATDGIIDQEGENNTRYGKSKFQDLIIKNSNEGFEKQKDKIISSFLNFKNEFEQSDDITVIGLELKQ